MPSKPTNIDESVPRLALANHRSGVEPSTEQRIDELRALYLQLLTVQGDITRQVAQLRLDGVSWAKIAEAMHVSPQAAHQRWSPDGREKHRLRQRRLNRAGDNDA